eukprot:CAMPEP_0113529980 /NCGR_PEP_ID=MMETSP0015_2-20120614/2689_1 /TAXON_ID=2838 /ORGANISM="Odontella" /LENGTH=816 /DNA_ID=CAMNT_0000428659 /DNA_START=109 /DNA_END=2559 /DNA_ORIENTATION=- /assembly_acc=CAM_ASM_000160
MVSLAGEKRKKSEVEPPGASPLPSPSETSRNGSNTAIDHGKNGGSGDKRDEEQPRPAPVRPRHHPTSSAAAYTDYSSVPDLCKIEDVLEINSKSDSPPHRREMNEDSIRRRGGGSTKYTSGGAEGNNKKDGGGGKGDNRRGPCPHATFPAKLHDILSRPDLGDVISWLDHGRAWHIIDQTAFVDRVMPHFFTQSKFASFMRQVNGWGFVRVTRGEEANSYYSEFFLRSKRSLARFMERKAAVRDLLGPEPNFAEYEDLPPNPEVDPASLLPLTPVEPTKVAATSKTKSQKKRRGARGNKRLTAGASGSREELIAVESALNRAILPHPTSMGSPGTPAVSINNAAPLQLVPYFQQQHVSGQPYTSQQFLSSLPPPTILHNQTSFQSMHAHQQQQQAAFATPNMPQQVPQMPVQVPSGAMMTMPNVQSSPMVVNQGFPQQHSVNPSSNTAGNPMTLAYPIPQQVPQAFPRVSVGNSALPMPLHPQQQQNHGTNISSGTTFRPAQGMITANSSSHGGTAALGQQQSHQQQCHFNINQSPHENIGLTQSGQQAALEPKVYQQHLMQQHQDEQQMQGQMHMHVHMRQPHALLQQQQQQRVWNQHPVSNNVNPQIGPARPARNHVQHLPNGATQGHTYHQQNAGEAPHLTSLGTAAATAQSVANIAQPRPLGGGPAFASFAAAPASVSTPALVEALMGKGGAGNTRVASGAGFSANPSPAVYPGNDPPGIGSTVRMKSPRGEGALGLFSGGNYEAGDTAEGLLIGHDGDSESISIGGGMEMDDMDISGIIPITMAGNIDSTGSLEGALEEDGLMDGSLDDIW